VSRSLVAAGADAEDAVQEALLKAWADFQVFREGASFGAWVLGYLVNTIRNRNRRLRRQLEVPLSEEIEDPEAALSREMAYEEFFERPESVLDAVEDRLAGAILELSPAERLVLLLRAVGELSYREIAAALNMPEGTAMSHLSRARKRLRAALSAAAGEKPAAGERGAP